MTELVASLPPEFQLQDLYRFIPRLVSKHPGNSHVTAKVRQVLQQLRDEDLLEFLGDGRYRHPATQAPGLAEATSLPLAIGQETTRAELAAWLEKGSAALRRGMFKPASGPYRNHMILFHNEAENPYGDVHEGSWVRYVGQGMSGNQTLQGFNGILANHADFGVQVHYFVQPKEKPGVIRYVGPMFVDSYDEVHRLEEGRRIIEFTLLPVRETRGGEALASYGEAMDAVAAYDRPPGPVTRPLVESLVQRRIRDRAFQRRVLVGYGMQCAVCGEPLRKGSLHELEAAHIMAVSANGPDELRNGLAMCRRHHWAFDHGFFTLRPNQTVEWLAPAPDPHEEVRDGQDIHLPAKEHHPDPVYVGWHRKQWRDVGSIVE